LADHEIQANNLTRLSHPAYSPDLTRPTSGFWVSKSYAEKELIPNGRGAARKGVNPDIDLQSSI
jgi:hypothetical protein